MKIISKFTSGEFFLALGFMIGQLGLDLSELITIKNNTPCHIFIILVFGNFGYYIKSFADSIVTIICLILILFMSLVFCEIIEINYFGLSENTKNKIVERAKSETTLCEKKDLNVVDDSDEIKIQLEDMDNSLIYEKELE